MTKPYLTTCIIAKNEEAMLPRCLESLVGVVDEIILCDTGSTDNTIKIAEEYGATITHFKWCDDFSAARNASLRSSNGTWNLIIDCDEHLEGELAVPGMLKSALRELQAERPDDWPVLFVKVPLIDKDVDEIAAHGMTKQLRIVANDPRVYFESPIHNRLAIAPELKVKEGCSLELNSRELRIIHRGYDQNVYRSKQKSERSFRLLKKALAAKPDALNYFYLGREYSHIDSWVEAIEALRKSRDLFTASDSPLSKSNLQSVYHYLVMCMNKAGLPLEEIREELMSALDEFPNSPDLWSEAGSIFLEHGEFESALGAMDQAKTLLPRAEENESSFLVYRSWVLHLNRAKVLGLLGRVEEGRQALRDAVAANMPNPEPVLELLNAKTVNGFVRAGVASIPARVEHLEAMIGSIIDQIDELDVYLNNFDSVPDFLKNPKIQVWTSQKMSGDLRDSGKFFGVCFPCDYFFALDDDIIYPANYVDTLVAKIEEYGRRAVIGVHGARLKKPVKSYIRDREVYHCALGLDEDKAVDIIGTGTLAFHRDTLMIEIGDFQVHGMADIWFSKLCDERGVDCFVVTRRPGWITVLQVDTGTLWEEAAKDDTIQTALVQDLSTVDD